MKTIALLSLSSFLMTTAFASEKSEKLDINSGDVGNLVAFPQTLEKENEEIEKAAKILIKFINSCTAKIETQSSDFKKSKMVKKKKTKKCLKRDKAFDLKIFRETEENQINFFKDDIDYLKNFTVEKSSDKEKAKKITDKDALEWMKKTQQEALNDINERYKTDVSYSLFRHYLAKDFQYEWPSPSFKRHTKKDKKRSSN